jgi:hypothetical protein
MTKKTTVKEADVPAAQKCKHLNAPHHSRGKCAPCYRQFRKAQWQSKTKLSKSWTKSPYKVAKKAA